VGGYLAAFAETLNDCANFLGVVEDTNNGHWRYAKTDQHLHFPVLSIARSPIKAIEDSQIGDAVVHSIERIMREQLHRVTKGINALVIGFGKIGSSCAQALSRRGMHTAVFDSDPVKLVSARANGCKVASLNRLLAEADLVVGATGHCSLNASSFASLKDGVVLASASSRQIEFDIHFLKKSFQQERIAPDVERYLGANGRSVYLFSEGYPVNFRDFSVLGDVLDAVYSELFLCVRELFEGRASVGLSDSWASIHAEVAEAWCDCHLHLRHKGASKTRFLTPHAAEPGLRRAHHNGNDQRFPFAQRYPARRKSKIAKSVQPACKIKEVKHA
jgi:adenosylhomocysteinase